MCSKLEVGGFSLLKLLSPTLEFSCLYKQSCVASGVQSTPTFTACANGTCLLQDCVLSCVGCAFRSDLVLATYDDVTCFAHPRVSLFPSFPLSLSFKSIPLELGVWAFGGTRFGVHQYPCLDSFFKKVVVSDLHGRKGLWGPMQAKRACSGKCAHDCGLHVSSYRSMISRRSCGVLKCTANQSIK